MEKDGVTRIVADDAFVAAIKEKTTPLEEPWIADADSLGVDGVAALKFLREQASSVQAGG